MDGIDGGLSDSIPDLPSFLPGLSRSTFLASKEQLDNLVGVVSHQVHMQVVHYSVLLL